MTAYLQPGETLLWIGKPNPKYATLIGNRVPGCGTTGFLGLGIVGIVLVAGILFYRKAEPALYSLLLIPGTLVIMGLSFLNSWQNFQRTRRDMQEQATNTVYGVTEVRVLTALRTATGVVVEAISLRAVYRVTRVDGEAGYSFLYVNRPDPDDDGEWLDVLTMAGVANAEPAEQLLRGQIAAATNEHS